MNNYIEIGRRQGEFRVFQLIKKALKEFLILWCLSERHAIRQRPDAIDTADEADNTLI